MLFIATVVLLLLLGFLYFGVRLYHRHGTPVPWLRWIGFIALGLLLALIVRGFFNSIHPY